MKNFTTILSVLLVLSSFQLFAQSQGSISGHIFNANDSLSIPGAHVLIQTGQKKYWASTDINGHFKIKPIEPGAYSVLVTFAGLDSMRISNVLVTPGLDTYLKKKYLSNRTLGEVEIIWKEDLIDEDGKNIIKVDAKTLDVLPTRGNLKMVLRYMSSDYFVSERTQEVHYRGSRAGTSAYYIDGMRVDDMRLPGMGVGSMQIYGGGVPAMYGDFTGGVIVVETKSYNDWLQEKNARNAYVKYTDAPKHITVKEENKEEKASDEANEEQKEEKNEKQEEEKNESEGGNESH
jgi:hypothetical protein